MRRKIRKPFRDYEEDLVDRLKEPVEYLKAAIDEKDETRIFMNALSHIAKARGCARSRQKHNSIEKAFIGFSPKMGILR